MSLIADAANVSADGKLNVLGRFGVVFAPSLPAMHPSMVLVVELQADSFEAGETKKIEVVLSDPDGHEMSRVNATAVLPTPTAPGPMNSLMILDFRALNFQKPGPYSFATTIDGVTKQPTTDFSVVLIPQSGARTP